MPLKVAPKQDIAADIILCGKVSRAHIRAARKEQLRGLLRKRQAVDIGFGRVGFGRRGRLRRGLGGSIGRGIVLVAAGAQAKRQSQSKQQTEQAFFHRQHFLPAFIIQERAPVAKGIVFVVR